MKRLIDVVTSLLGLVILLPLLSAIAMIIVLTSGRPVIFSHLRVGQNGNRFVLLKFRTMQSRPGAQTGTFEPGSRARITAAGRFLRATKLDELPQLWNVLKGEMSLVGPRPEVPAWVAVYPKRWKDVLSIKPGITDPASLAFRNEEMILAASSDPEATYREVILPRKLSIYEEYLKTRTQAGDLRIMAETVVTLICNSICRK